jgi:RecG-like helicase
MQAPVDTPLKRASVSTATCLPKSRMLQRRGDLEVSSIPEPIGPRQISTNHVARLNRSGRGS